MGLDLRSGRSYWFVRSPPPSPFPPLEYNARADVVIIGAGVTGALAAAVLVEAGLDVIVLDRRAPAHGSTGASTALLSHEPDLSLSRMAAKRGWETAVHAYHAARDANQELAALIRRLDIRCDYRRAKSFHIARTPRQARALREEHRLRNEAGLRCDLVGARELSRRCGLVAAAALVSPDAGQLDPVRLTAGLLDYVVASGSRCYSARVSRVEKTARAMVAHVKGGARVTARRVVCATGYETQLRLRQRTVQLVSTYAIATDVLAPLPRWLRTAILWDMGAPYHYARSAGGRMLVGGGDEPFVDEKARDALMPRKARALGRYLNTVLPGLDAGVALVWCGTFARTDDSLPYIGERAGMPGVVFSLGYGGNGITAGMLGALHARNAILARRDPAGAVFSFARDSSLR